VTVALTPVVSSSELVYALVVSVDAENTIYTIYTFNATCTMLHMSQEHIHVLRKWPQDIPRSLLTLGTWVVTHRTTDISPDRTIGTASSKPHLEPTGAEFTSPDGRILTFLPCRRYIVTESK
jgi:hypothetical protein